MNPLNRGIIYRVHVLLLTASSCHPRSKCGSATADETCGSRTVLRRTETTPPQAAILRTLGIKEPPIIHRVEVAT